MQSGLVATLMSIAMIAAFLLAAGGVWMLVKGRDRKRGLLMLLAALVTLGNVLIWVVPL
jgi:hypothetical protein